MWEMEAHILPDRFLLNVYTTLVCSKYSREYIMSQSWLTLDLTMPGTEVICG